MFKALKRAFTSRPKATIGFKDNAETPTTTDLTFTVIDDWFPNRVTPSPPLSDHSEGVTFNFADSEEELERLMHAAMLRRARAYINMIPPRKLPETVEMLQMLCVVHDADQTSVLPIYAMHTVNCETILDFILPPKALSEAVGLLELMSNETCSADLIIAVRDLQSRTLFCKDLRTKHVTGPTALRIR